METKHTEEEILKELENFKSFDCDGHVAVDGNEIIKLITKTKAQILNDLIEDKGALNAASNRALRITGRWFHNRTTKAIIRRAIKAHLKTEGKP